MNNAFYFDFGGGKARNARPPPIITRRKALPSVNARSTGGREKRRFGHRISFSLGIGTARLQNRVDLDQLEMEIETNGAFECDNLLSHASGILVEQFQALSGVGKDGALSLEIGRTHEARINPFCFEKIDALSLTVRSQNCLRQEGIRFVGELVQKEERALLSTPHLGRKSLTEIKAALETRGLSLGMVMPNWRAPRQ